MSMIKNAILIPESVDTDFGIFYGIMGKWQKLFIFIAQGEEYPSQLFFAFVVNVFWEKFYL